MTEPRLHPNGFIQYDLPNNAGRMHIWHPDLPVAQIVHTPIHDHTFDFESTVIYGRLTHTTFIWEGAHDGDYRLHRAVVAVEEDTRLVSTGLVGDMTVNRIQDFDRGYSYFFAAGRFHTSTAKELVATVMTKTRINVSPYPFIAVPVSVDPDNNFRRHQADVEEMWEYVELVGRLTSLTVEV